MVSLKRATPDQMYVLGSICRVGHKMCDFNLYKSKSLLSILIHYNGSRAQGITFPVQTSIPLMYRYEPRRYSFSTSVTLNFQS